jgi:hypothetical protein
MKLKLFDAIQVIRIYNSKLDDREKRKRFVIDRGLVDKREQIAVSGHVSSHFSFHFFFSVLSCPLLFLLLSFPFSPFSFLLSCHIPFFFCVLTPHPFYLSFSSRFCHSPHLQSHTSHLSFYLANISVCPF